MRTSYDPETDAFYARFVPEQEPIILAREVAPGVMLDLAADGNVVGIEVLGIRQRAAGAYHPATPAAAE